MTENNETCSVCGIETNVSLSIDHLGILCKQCAFETHEILEKYVNGFFNLKGENLLTLEDALDYREGIDGNHEQVKAMADTIIALYKQISVLKNSVVKSESQRDFSLI